MAGPQGLFARAGTCLTGVFELYRPRESEIQYGTPCALARKLRRPYTPVVDGRLPLWIHQHLAGLRGSGHLARLADHQHRRLDAVRRDHVVTSPEEDC